jgi:hypothetical protein
MSKQLDATPEIKKPLLPYVKPMIAWEEPFEPVTSALSCAKRPGQGGACMGAPRL